MDILSKDYLLYENVINYVNVGLPEEESFKVEANDLVFVRSSETKDEVGWAKTYRDTNYSLYSGFVIRGKVYGDVNSFFVENTLNYKQRRQIQALANGSTRYNISQQTLNSIKISLPQLEEQNRISILLEKIDSIITLEQEKHELLVNYKKYLIQNIFKQEHSKTKSLKEVATITTGKLNANAMVKDGRYDFYTSGISKYKINEYAFEGPAITIAGNGATVGFMHMANGKFNAYQRTYVLQNFKINRDYLFYNIQKELPRKIHEESRTGSIPYIVMDMLEDLPIYVTDQNKMNQLGNLLYLVNSILDKSSLRIEKIIKTKDFLLQQLFI